MTLPALVSWVLLVARRTSSLIFLQSIELLLVLLSVQKVDGVPVCIILTTLLYHAYPHKSGMMLCDVFVMQEERHGKAWERFVA